jgi:DnaK suppressor protein
MNSAVDKINDVYFGQCVGCGKSIPMGRLLLLPGSTKCVNCAS